MPACARRPRVLQVRKLAPRHLEGSHELGVGRPDARHGVVDDDHEVGKRVCASTDGIDRLVSIAKRLLVAMTTATLGSWRFCGAHGRPWTRGKPQRVAAPYRDVRDRADFRPALETVSTASERTLVLFLLARQGSAQGGNGSRSRNRRKA